MGMARQGHTNTPPPGELNAAPRVAGSRRVGPSTKRASALRVSRISRFGPETEEASPMALSTQTSPFRKKNAP